MQPSLQPRSSSRLLAALAALVGVMLVASAAFSADMSSTPAVVAAAPAVAPDGVARGKYLFDGADCGGCHGGDRTGAAPAGGLGLDTPFGTFYVPNITPEKDQGIGSWSEADFKTALRDGVGHQGEYLFPVFPYTSFTKMSDADISDLYTYLGTFPPSPTPNKPHEVKAPFGWRWLVRFWQMLFFRSGPLQDDAGQSPAWNRGRYLVEAVAHCEECHTPRNFLGALSHGKAFSGNVGGPDGQNAPNITSDVKTGIGDWSEDDIVHLLKSGMTPDSDLVGSGMKAVVRGTSRLTDADRHAIAIFLKTVPPIHTETQPAPKSTATPATN